jgi:hypothetical protein
MHDYDYFMQMNKAQNLEAHDMDEATEDPMHDFILIMSLDQFKLLIDTEFEYLIFYPTKTDKYKVFREQKTHIVAMAIINPNQKEAMWTIGRTAIYGI